MFQFPRLMPLTRGLLIATAVSFLLHSVVQVWLQSPWGLVLALRAGDLSPWTALQLFTHPLAWAIKPRSALELAFALVMLWWFVSPFEERYGKKAAAQLLALATLSAGVLAALVGLLTPPDYVLGPNNWVFASLGALGWSLRYAPMDILGLRTRGEAYVWFALALVGINFLTDPRVPTLVAELAAIGAGVGFVAWRRRRLPKARVSSVVSIDAARRSRDGKNKKEWLN
ncbi:MAG: rhomboid family intramembrane serine protease [Sandaracinaceae bacterium]|nr:rhomboid family intramembrane serine protease [Sandaracinaceae bacterium]